MKQTVKRFKLSQLLGVDQKGTENRTLIPLSRVGGGGGGKKKNKQGGGGAGKGGGGGNA